MDQSVPSCCGDHCGKCCGGTCGGCGDLELTQAEADLLLTFAELPFQPVVSRSHPRVPVYAYPSDGEDGETQGKTSSDVINALEHKYLIRVDWDIPLGNYDYPGFEDYELRGSMALTYRGQMAVDELFRMEEGMQAYSASGEE